MGAFVDQVTDAPLWTSLDDLTSAVDEISATTADEFDLIGRVRAVCERTREFREGDPYSFPSSWRQNADQLDAYARSLISYLNQWRDGSSGAAVAGNLTSTMDPWIGIINSWPRQSDRSYARATVKAAQDFKRDVERGIEAVASQIGAAKQEIEQIRLMGSQHQSQNQAVLASNQQRVEQLQQEIESWRGQQGTRFDAAIDKVKADSEAAIQSIMTETSSATGRIEAEVESALTKVEDEAASRLEALTKAAESGEKLAALIGGAGVADGYNTYANDQKSAAFWWSLAAIVVGVASLAFLAAALWNVHDSDSVQWPLVLLKSGVTVTALTVAGYAARLGTHHREQAVRAKFRALDMLALEPFISELGDQQRHALRFRVADRVFGHDLGSVDGRNAGSEPDLVSADGQRPTNRDAAS